MYIIVYDIYNKLMYKLYIIVYYCILLFII